MKTFDFLLTSSNVVTLVLKAHIFLCHHYNIYFLICFLELKKVKIQRK